MRSPATHLIVPPEGEPLSTSYRQPYEPAVRPNSPKQVTTTYGVTVDRVHAAKNSAIGTRNAVAKWWSVMMVTFLVPRSNPLT